MIDASHEERRAASARTRAGILADLALFAITLVWGTTFVIVKNTVDAVPPVVLIFLRFLIATWVTYAWLYFSGRAKRGPEYSRTVRAGAIVGIPLFFGFYLQTIGIQYTTAGKAGLITGLNVVMVPILSTLWMKKAPGRLTVIGAVLGMIGLSRLTFAGPFVPSIGDFLMFLCAVGYAVHIVLVDKYTQDMDGGVLALAQLGMVTAASGLIMLGSMAFGKLTIPDGMWRAAALPVIYLGFMATALAYVVQTVAQRYTNATRTALIFTLEPVFAAIFAWMWRGEVMTAGQLFGGVLIVAGILLSQLEGVALNPSGKAGTAADAACDGK